MWIYYRLLGALLDFSALGALLDFAALGALEDFGPFVAFGPLEDFGALLPFGAFDDFVDFNTRSEWREDDSAHVTSMARRARWFSRIMVRLFGVIRSCCFI